MYSVAREKGIHVGSQVELILIKKDKKYSFAAKKIPEL